MRIGLALLLAAAAGVAEAEDIYRQGGEAHVFTNVPTGGGYAPYTPENTFPPAVTHEKTPDTPLHEAVAWNKTAEVERLLAAGANVDAHGYRGVTPLMRAALAGNAAMIDLLLARGARWSITADNGNTALHYAAMWRPHRNPPLT